MKTAVKKILSGRNREEHEAFQRLRAHYVYQAEFCNVTSGNEKGQVENMVGYARRNFFVPLPEVNSLDELNEQIERKCLNYAETTQVPHSQELIAQVWKREKSHLLPLPRVPFDACRVVSVQVDHYSLVHLDTNAYSVPCQRSGRSVLLKAYVDEIRILAGAEILAIHRRCYERKQWCLQLDHCVDLLSQKPGHSVTRLLSKMTTYPLYTDSSIGKCGNATETPSLTTSSDRVPKTMGMSEFNINNLLCLIPLLNIYVNKRAENGSLFTRSQWITL
ncbi:transposase [Heliobacterium mobile]|uniref:transposase n=1 Tax=Heliobacterium mobile TaxID=28064 RepID=UPI001479159D|nr:transposase [Heliobacterium mobile]